MWTSELTELDYVVFVNKLYRRITRRRAAAAPSSSLDLASVARLAIDRALDDGGSGAGGGGEGGGGGGGGWSGASRLASYASGVRVLAAAAARVFLTPADVTKPLNESTKPRRRRRGSTTGGGKHKKGGLGKGAKPAKKTPEKAPKKGGRRGSLDVMLGAAPTPSKLAAPDEALASFRADDDEGGGGDDGRRRRRRRRRRRWQPTATTRRRRCQRRSSARRVPSQLYGE